MPLPVADPVTRLGKYGVRGVAGRGAMGTVYDGWDPELQRRVAIKRLNAVTDDRALERFRREARTIAALNHPNIITVHDLGNHEGTPFIVMEFVEGASLAELIEQDRAFAPADKLRLIADICLALGCAHGAGIIHRDVKPTNIRLSTTGTIKLLDFGVAHLAGSSLTRTEEMIGTPAYVAPEIIRGAPPDPRTDIYSLAATLYEWLTGERPFAAPAPDSLMWKIVHDEVRPIRQVWPACPPAIARIVESGLAKDPADRFRDAAAMRGDLMHAREQLLNAPAMAVAPARRARPDADQHRFARSIVASILLVIVCGTGAALVMMDRNPVAPLGRPGSAAVVAASAKPALAIGTPLAVQVLTDLQADRIRVGASFNAITVAATVVNGREVVALNTPAVGRVERVESPGAGAAASIELSLTEISIGGRATPIRTARHRVASIRAHPPGDRVTFTLAEAVPIQP